MSKLPPKESGAARLERHSIPKRRKVPPFSNIYAFSYHFFAAAVRGENFLHDNSVTFA